MTQRINSEIVEQTNTSHPVSIFFEDEYVIVVSKPDGILSQPDHTGDMAITDLLEQHCTQRDGKRSNLYLIHRLDRPVSGLMVLAKRKDAAQHLTKQFREHRVRKSYWALCEGILPRNGVLQHWIQKLENPVMAKVYDQNHPKAKQATLSFRCLETTSKNGSEFSLAEVHLQTGRTHQIRAQLAHINHPIVGDIKYGSTLDSVPIHLRSVMLEFEHPKDDRLLTYYSHPSESDYWEMFSNLLPH